MKSRVADFEEGMAPVLPPEAVEALSLRPGDGVGLSIGPEGVVPGRSEMRPHTDLDLERGDVSSSTSSRFAGASRRGCVRR